MAFEGTQLELSVAAAGARRDQSLRSQGARRRRRGIVHTPPEVARHLTACADEALRGELGLRQGLADARVTIVDPACGPGAFLAAGLTVAAGRPSAPAAILGIDLDQAALASARACLDEAYARAGWPLQLSQRNALEDLSPWGARAVDTVVVLGNPPWAARSANRGARATARLLEDFRRGADGEPLAERKVGVLSDDYVRFFRWGAELVRRAPAGGVLAFVTNASFVDGPVHRGMRAALLRWFDGIDVLDLGGGSLVARGAGVDENVFGVRPSVAVTVAWRRGGAARCRVRHGVLAGTRSEKLSALAPPPPLDEVAPGAPWFLFRPHRSAANYDGWLSLAEAMPFHAEGVQTNRDAVVVDIDRDRLMERLTDFAEGRHRQDLTQALGRLRHYDPDRAREALSAALAAAPDRTSVVQRLAYRPGDDRWFAPVTPLCHRPRPALLRAMGHGGLALLTVRKDRGHLPWNHYGAALHVPDNCWHSVRSSCRTRAFPEHAPDGTPNLAPLVAAEWSARLETPVDAATFVRYALALLAASSFRRAFDADLHLDYPRIVCPPDGAAFRSALAAGEAVAQALEAANPPDGAGGAADLVGHHAVHIPGLKAALGQAEAAVARILAQVAPPPVD